MKITNSIPNMVKLVVINHTMISNNINKILVKQQKICNNIDNNNLVVFLIILSIFHPGNKIQHNTQHLVIMEETIKKVLKHINRKIIYKMEVKHKIYHNTNNIMDNYLVGNVMFVVNEIKNQSSSH